MRMEPMNETFRQGNPFAALLSLRVWLIEPFRQIHAIWLKPAKLLSAYGILRPPNSYCISMIMRGHWLFHQIARFYIWADHKNLAYGILRRARKHLALILH